VPTASPYAAAEVTKPPNWHGLVAWDTLLNGLTTGLYLATALGELAAPAVFAAVARAAYPLALVFLLADLALLVIDLGNPRRFHHMLWVFKPYSPMSFGVWSLTAYSVPLTVVVALEVGTMWGVNLEGARRAAVVVGLAPALAAAVYKGVLFSTSAQPGWRDARWLGGYLASAAVLLGCAELLLLAVVGGQERAVVVLRPALGLLLVVNAVPLGLTIAELWPALRRRCPRGQLRRSAALCLGAGVLVPLGLVFVGGAVPLVLAVGSLLLGSVVSRFVIVQVPHYPTPASGRR
jgi:hypothetical protein